MKICLITVLFTLSSLAQAGLNMKPGKWQIESKMPGNGSGQEDPMAAMREAMKNMPPEQRKMMEESINKAMKEHAKSNKNMPMVKMDANGISTCYTKEMLEGDIGMKKQYEDKNCNVSNFQKTSSSISMTFKCKDGSTGDVKVSVADPTHFNGKVKMTMDDGEKSEIELKGTFLSDKCD